MKKSRFFIVVLCVVTAMLAAFTLVGCGETATVNAVIGIQKTATTEDGDRYTVTYADGSTSTIEIKNGKDGAAADVGELFDAYKKENPDATFEDFLKLVSTPASDGNTYTIAKALRSSMKVYTEFTEAYYSGWGRPQVQYNTNIYCGSAVIYRIDDDYTYMITNYHVMYDAKATENNKLAKKVVCYLYGSESSPAATDRKGDDGCTVYEYGDYGIECEYVGGSITADIAVIKAETAAIKTVNPDIAAIEFADGYVVGQTAIAIGNPEDEGISVTQGIISVDNEYITLAIDNVARSYRSVRIDTALYSGNSGGGLFDTNGKLIGITNAGDGDDQNVNFAIPVDIVKAAVNNIMHYNDGSAKKITLGITVGSENSKYVYDKTIGLGRITEDVFVRTVEANSIATLMDIREGDRITAITINGETTAIDRYFRIGDMLYYVREGSAVSLTLYRDGVEVKSTEYTVTAADLKIVA